MHVNMIHPASGKELGKVQGIARALLCLGPKTILAVVLFDQITWPILKSFRVTLEDL
jgi:hypothetical protein